MRRFQPWLWMGLAVSVLGCGGEDGPEEPDLGPGWAPRELHRTRDPEEMCMTAVVSARAPEGGECLKFPSPCDVPEDWVDC